MSVEEHRIDRVRNHVMGVDSQSDFLAVLSLPKQPTFLSCHSGLKYFRGIVGNITVITV